MSSSKDVILGRVRSALSGTPFDAEIPREYRAHGELTRDQVLEQFVEYVADYKADVQRVPAEGLRDAILALVGEDSCVIPVLLEHELGFSLPGPWLRDEGDLDKLTLNSTVAVVTTSAVGISSTGTIVLDGGAGQGRRVDTLLPDHHVCIVREGDVVELVPEAIARLDATHPQTWISGPSATSDIELSRVEGVHGPRRLSVLLVP